MGIAIFFGLVVVLAFLTIKNPAYAVLALICMFAVEQWGAINIAQFSKDSDLLNILILGLVIFSWFRLPTGSSLEFIGYPLRLTIIVLVTYALVSSGWAPLEAHSTSRFINHSYYIVTMLFLAPLLVRKHEDFTAVLDAFTVFGGVLVVLFAFIPDFENRGIATSFSPDERVKLPLALANFSGYILIVAALRMKLTILSILWTAVIFGSSIYLLTKTGSRGQLIFALAALVICLPTVWRQFSVNKILIYVVTAALVAFTFYIVISTENTLSQRLASERVDQATGGRIEMITTVLEQWSLEATSIIFGLGSSASWAIIGVYPHNVPLEILAELGLLGFCLFASVIAVLFASAYSRTVKSNFSNDTLRDFGALFGCFVFLLLVSLKQASFLTSPDLLLFAVLSEKCARLGRKDIREQTKRTRRQRRLANEHS